MFLDLYLSCDLNSYESVIFFHAYCEILSSICIITDTDVLTRSLGVLNIKVWLSLWKQLYNF